MCCERDCGSIATPCLTDSRRNAEYLYPAIKNWSATVAGIPSQCAQVGKVKRMGSKPDYLYGLLLKMNVKLRGENAHPNGTCLLDATPTIVFGVDVNHSGIGRSRA